MLLPPLLTLVAIFVLAAADEPSTEELLKQVQLPSGFEIELWAQNLTFARSLDRSLHTVFVGSFDFDGIQGNEKKSSVYAIDIASRTVYTVATNLAAPNGVAYHGGDLYIAENKRLWVIRGVEKHLTDPPPPTLLSDSFWSGAYPLELWHGWRYMHVHDGRLYMSIGAPCNTPADPPVANSTCKCLIAGDPCSYPDVPSRAYIGSIVSGELPQFTDVRVEAHGIRNSVGFAWHPNGELWFTDNGRDNMNPDHNNRPPDELNRVRANSSNKHFGFPFCYGKDIVDPEFNKAGNCDAYVGADQALGAHVAALGMRFYNNAKTKSFPAHYHSGVFVAEHGSWNRAPPTGYRVMFVPLDGVVPQPVEVFGEGWLEPGSTDSMHPNAWGRPVDVELLDDGSMLVSDGRRGCIYRISYAPTDYTWIVVGVLIGVVVLAVLSVLIIKLRARTTAAEYDKISD